MTAQPYNRFAFVSWSWHLTCNGNQVQEHNRSENSNVAAGLAIPPQLKTTWYFNQQVSNTVRLASQKEIKRILQFFFEVNN